MQMLWESKTKYLHQSFVSYPVQIVERQCALDPQPHDVGVAALRRLVQRRAATVLPSGTQKTEAWQRQRGNRIHRPTRHKQTTPSNAAPRITARSSCRTSGDHTSSHTGSRQHHTPAPFRKLSNAKSDLANGRVRSQFEQGLAASGVALNRSTVQRRPPDLNHKQTTNEPGPREQSKDRRERQARQTSKQS